MKKALFLLVGISFLLPANGQNFVIRDVADESDFQDFYLGHFKRGRALIAADFDLDGRQDFYVGNPGDESFILRNTEGPGLGRPRFVMHEVLLDGVLAWGGAAADYDNDGDYDLMITCGANEGVCFDYLFKNMLMEEGTLRFEDVTELAGIKGPIPEGSTTPMESASANAMWGDYNQDGWLDLFVSVNIFSGSPMDQNPDFEAPLAADDEETGRNALYRNNGDGTFTDVTIETGLAVSLSRTRHSTWFDFDNDGDLDLFENNYGDFNILWQNQLAETGNAVFTDVTTTLDGFPNQDIRFPFDAFVSASNDFNNDGWEDLIIFTNGGRRENEQGNPYGVGHALFINDEGRGFVNMASQTGLNNGFIAQFGVMGCQIEDVNADGLIDVYIGNGGPPSGQFDQVFFSSGSFNGIPRYQDNSNLIDFEAPQVNLATYPSYPYRTHGTAIVDIDGDGLLEIAVNNGGPFIFSDEVREPNRLFKLDNWSTRPNYFSVRPVGHGNGISRDAIGTRLALTVEDPGGAQRTIHRSLNGGSCFSAQNGFDVFFGLQQANRIVQLEIIWPNGMTTVHTEGLTVNTNVVIEGPDGELPVELSQWQAVLDGEDVMLTWQTASETNNKGFEIQHLAAGASTSAFAPVRFVPGQGTSTTTHTYTERIPNLKAGTHRFRLKQVDFDGNAIYSPAVEVVVGVPETYQLSAVYPNPFNPRAQFSLSLEQTQAVRITVSDVLGRVHQVLHQGELTAQQEHTFLLDGTSLASGVYFVRVEGERFAAVRRVTLLK